ncbi:hypothetical protein [Paraflavitalea pollutisoli]|uniref:hypothetical protein n=1 Tax=Paraflavitalea pollutisoli TaxID=3034143 RepID=UPI0023EC705C|nr:hypothetical protein [Paraflavitalea sp. H1-2-19X]
MQLNKIAEVRFIRYYASSIDYYKDVDIEMTTAVPAFCLVAIKAFQSVLPVQIVRRLITTSTKESMAAYPLYSPSLAGRT